MCSPRQAVLLSFTIKYFMETIIRLYKAQKQTLKFRHFEITALGKPSSKKSAVFLNIVQKAFDATIIDKITRKSMVKMLNLDKLTLYLGHF